MNEKQALVVDDSRSARFAMRKYLERYRYTVDTVDNGNEALGYLKDHRPQVVFLDQLMPGASGLEVLRALKNDPGTVAIPVVICTSIDRAEFWEEARSSGAVDVLPKPPSMDQLERLLEALDHPPVPGAVPVPPAEAVTAGPLVNPVLSEVARHYAALQNEIEVHLRRLTEDIFVQMAELKAQMVRLESDALTREERETLKRLAREDADSLEVAVRAEIQEVRRRLDTMDLLQRRERQDMIRMVRTTAALEAHNIAEHTVTDAVSRLSNKLTEALLRAMGRQP